MILRTTFVQLIALLYLGYAGVTVGMAASVPPLSIGRHLGQPSVMIRCTRAQLEDCSVSARAEPSCRQEKHRNDPGCVEARRLILKCYADCGGR